MEESKGMWFDQVEHMEEGQEKNKEWENYWWIVDEDMFTYVMKSKIEALIEEKLNQEFPEEVELREHNRKCTKTLSKAPCLVALRMSLTLHLLLFAQSM